MLVYDTDYHDSVVPHTVTNSTLQMFRTRLSKLIHILREDGLTATAGAIAGYTRRATTNVVAKLPGHYRLRRALLERRYEPDDITPQWVSPDDITYLTGKYETRENGHLDYVPRFKPREANWNLQTCGHELPYGSLVGGDWDLHREPFSKLLMYRGIRQHYLDGQPWPDTVYYERLIERFLDQGVAEPTAKSLAGERCENIESIYQTIESDGYLSQQELDGNPLHEVTVTVARDGTLLYNCEGRHRLSVAKVLDIEAIPVLVLARHPDYESQNTQNDPKGTLEP